MEITGVPPRYTTARTYFSKEIYALKLFGVSLVGNEGLLYKMYSIIFVLGAIFVYLILDSYEYFTQDLIGISEMVIYQVGGDLAVCKIIVVFRNRHKLLELLGRFEENPFLANPKRGGSKEGKLIKECLLITKVQTYTYWVVAILTITFTIVYGLVKHYFVKGHEYKLPYGSFSVVNTTYSPNYEIIFVYESISIAFIAASFTSIDLLLAAVLAHLCYQFRILQNNIRRMNQICYDEMKKDGLLFQNKNQLNQDLGSELDGSLIPWSYLKKFLKEAIEYHLAIIEIATELEKVLNNLFLIVFLGTLVLICFAEYSASVFSDSPQVAFTRLGEGMSACLQVGTVCYWGEQVMHESQQVGKAVMESNFVGTDLRYQRMLALIIRRSQNATKFTAGKFTPICLVTFTWILRTSYSSFMILRRANTD